MTAMRPKSNTNPPRTEIFQHTFVVSILFVVTVILAVLFAMGEDTSAMPAAPIRNELKTYLNFTALAGYFDQNEPGLDFETYDPKSANFGLIPRAYDSDTSLDQSHEYTDWQRFAHHVSALNEAAPNGTTYRLLYIGRHGQGYHNVAHLYYGPDAWDCYYSAFDGDPDEGSNITWLDAHLTLLGIDQAKNMSTFWRSQLNKQKMPAPQTYYVSPLDRACRTAELTFRALNDDGTLPASAPFKPTVKELLREGNGIHTCDKRSTRSYIAKTYPYYTIEPSLTENDELFDANLRESDSAHTARMTELLQDVLSTDPSNYISVTAHGGTISAILRAVGHRDYPLPVGSALPLLMKVEEVEGERPKMEVDPWAPKPACAKDPLNAGVEGYKNLQEYVEEIEKAYRRGHKKRAESMGTTVTSS